jgi:hypothetical protein
MQRLLRYACWDADAVRDDLHSYVAEHLAAGGPALDPGLDQSVDRLEVLAGLLVGGGVAAGAPAQVVPAVADPPGT